MTREQKRSLLLIAAAAVLLIGLHFVPVTGWLKLVLYLIPYLLVGMVLFTGLNYLGQRFFAFRSPKTEEK